MIKKIVLILIALLIVGGFGWLIYDQIFSAPSETTNDLKMELVEGGFWEKETVTAECEITADNKFCFKDTNWAAKENKIDFEGYIVVSYTNTADVIEEISIATIRLENVTPGKLTIRGTHPSEIFIQPQGSTQIRYDIAFDSDDEQVESVESSGLELQTTFTNIIGKKATQVFTIDYRN